ncbi:MAG TPA: ABC transporter substrate-binding protein [Acidimicrobiia bacterium]|nr:ABC transporter substrate-binding protein [Acidimicrobiia bacterium]
MERPLDASVSMISRRTLLRGAAGVGLAAATGTLLSACRSGGGEEREANGPGPDGPLETTSIRLFSVPPFNCVAAMYMAERFLQEEGFTEIQYPKIAPKDVVNSWAEGAIDFGVFYPANLAPRIEQGDPFVLLGGVHLGCWQVVASGDIKTMRDFEGKTVSIVGPHFTDGIFMAMTLASVGLDINRDVKLVNYPPTEWARVLTSGEVNGVVAVPPFSTDLQKKGIGHVVVNSVSDPPWSNYYCCSPVANRHWMERHPAAAKRALRAMLRGADVVAKDPLGTARFMVDRGYTNNYDYTCDLLKEMPYNVWRDFDPSDSVRFYALRLKEAGVITSPPEEIIKQGTDFRYFLQLRQELPTI